MSDDPSPDLSAMLAAAIENHNAGNLLDALAGYDAILDEDPRQTDALQLLGVITAQMGNTELGVSKIRESLAINPNQPVTLNNLGSFLAREGEEEDAIEAYEKAIDLNATYAEPHFHLGKLYAKRKNHTVAVDYFSKAVELNYPGSGIWYLLGLELRRCGRLGDSIEHLTQALEIEPDSEMILEQLGNSLRFAQRLDEAAAIYERWIKMSPENAIAKHYLRACGVHDRSDPDRVSSEYVVSTFDDYAETFDESLTELDYRSPYTIGKAVPALFAPKRIGRLRVADLGCGTGLCGVHLRKFAGHMSGVDLSPNMLKKAKERGIYDDLIESDLLPFLESQHECFDLIVSGDTLIYFGDLRPLLNTIAKSLSPGGKLLFTLEAPSSPEALEAAKREGFHLNNRGRYVHDETTIKRWLESAGLELLSLEEHRLRDEGSNSVHGHLVTAGRPS